MLKKQNMMPTVRGKTESKAALEPIIITYVVSFGKATLGMDPPVAVLNDCTLGILVELKSRTNLHKVNEQDKFSQ